MSFRSVSFASALPLLALVTAASAAPGCAGEDLAAREAPSSNEAFQTAADSFDLAPDAVVAQRAFSDTVTVKDDMIVVPTGPGFEDNRAFVTSLKNGRLLVGDRDHARTLAETGNPSGFLRRIVRVDEGQTEARITTTKAELDELFENGDLEWSADTRPLFDGPTEEVAGPSEGVQLLGVGGGVGGGLALLGDDERSDFSKCKRATFEKPLVLTDAANLTIELRPKLELSACFDGYYKKRFKVAPREVQAELKLAARGTIVAVATATARGSLNKTFEGPEFEVPLPGPVPTTLAVTPVATCQGTARAAVTATATGTASLQASGGFRWTGGTDLTLLKEEPTLEADFGVAFDSRAAVEAQCSLQLRVRVLAFDAAGIEGEAGPYVRAKGELCLPEKSLSVQYGAKAELRARLQVPVLNKGFSKTIFTKQWDAPEKFVVGTAASCADEPPAARCTGKADGLYCDPTDPSSAVRCVAGQVSEQKRCARGTCAAGADGKASLDAAAELVCR